MREHGSQHFSHLMNYISICKEKQEYLFTAGMYVSDKAFIFVRHTTLHQLQAWSIIILFRLCLGNEWMVSYLLDTITGFGKMIHMSYKLRMIPLDLFAVRNVIMERRWPKYYWLCGQEEGSDIISANFLSLISWLFVCNRGDTIHEDKLWCTIALIYV